MPFYTHHIIMSLDGGPFANPGFTSEAAARSFVQAILGFSCCALSWVYNGSNTWWGTMYPDESWTRVMFLGVIP
jgi:hypothetical protein